MRHIKSVILIGILLSTTSGGCGMILESPEISISPVQQLSPTTSAGITTQIPTAASTLPRTPILTTTLTSTMPFVPTLSVEEAKNRLHELLSNNGNCRLPCLWGITPGESTDQNALDILAPLRGISVYWDYYTDHTDSNFTIGGIDIHYPVNSNNYYFIHVGFVSERNIIVYVGLRAIATKAVSDGGTVDIYDSKEFGEMTQIYSLANILSEYGVPDSIHLSMVNKQCCDTDDLLNIPNPFEWILQYPDQGIFVQYLMAAQVEGEHIIGCPVNAAIDLDGLIPGVRKTTPNSIPQAWAHVFPPFKSVEEVANMTKKQFHQVFSKTPDKCLVTLASDWPGR